MSWRIAFLPGKLRILILLGCCLISEPASAQIQTGYDLRGTVRDPFGSVVSGATVGLPPGAIPLQGIPISPGNLGNTDTIVQRFNGGTPPFTINVQLLELSLESINPVNISGSFFDVFVVIDTPGFNLAPPPVTPLTIPILTPSLGQYAVPDGLHVNSFFDIFVDVQLQDHFNPASKFDLGQHEIQLSGNGLWTQITPALYPIVPNFPAGGFYLNGPLQLQGSGQFQGDNLRIADAQVPEPATGIAALGALAAITLGLRRRRLGSRRRDCFNNRLN